MTDISLLVNGDKTEGRVEPRTSLADFLRDHLHLTGTHLRCEQGVCGTCTLLIDGAPARSCITYAVLCQESEVTTIEGLEQDPVMKRLRAAFSREHALQCGFCTPGMLVTARDIVMRLPDADEQRVKLELSGNLCRCTGYAGIVRAICGVLGELKTFETIALEAPAARLGPVGARNLATAKANERNVRPEALPSQLDEEFGSLGLGGREPNLESAFTFLIQRPAGEVWDAFADLERIAACMPGATLTAPPVDGKIHGKISIKVGPVTANFTGAGLVVRDEPKRRGTVYGAGRDRLSGSNARAEISYEVAEAGSKETRVTVAVRSRLAGPLAQFGRTQIAQDIMGRLAADFGSRLEYMLEHGSEARPPRGSALKPAAIVIHVLVERFKALFRRLFMRGKSPDRQ